ncbi:hypothetical protein D1O30_19420 [Methylocystis hirsuta]|uniref:Uncharacterized protein n=1 Tax=Methylocystis hirsuta TaxID=369798 RepID=A0A3M9XMC6_9HYPH|nr:hypothetical protein D1O30_19420 [Methylocystis hirsuta]
MDQKPVEVREAIAWNVDGRHDDQERGRCRRLPGLRYDPGLSNTFVSEERYDLMIVEARERRLNRRDKRISRLCR